MKIQPADRAIVLRTLRNRGITKKELAEAIGARPAWVTKFLNGTTGRLVEEKRLAMEKFLGFEFRNVSPENVLPEWASQFVAVAKKNPEVQTIAQSLIDLAGAVGSIGELRWFSTEELRKIGAEVTRIVARWDENSDPHYARIGREVVEYLSTLAGMPKMMRAAEEGPEYGA